MLAGVYLFLYYQLAQEKGCLWFVEDRPLAACRILPTAQAFNDIPSCEVRSLFFSSVYHVSKWWWNYVKLCLYSTTWLSHCNAYLRRVWPTNIQFCQNLFISLRKLANPSPKLQITHGKMYFYQGLPNWLLRWVRVAMETIILNCLRFQCANFHP